MTNENKTVCEWISVEDRLPDENSLNKKFLVYLPKYNDVTIGKYSHYYYGIGFYSISSEDENGYPLYIGEKVTHWAELPDPPESAQD